jgi:hypothetical protein
VNKRLQGKKTKSDDGKSREGLNPQEWDFCTVQECELATATLYEYTRSCSRVRATYEEWHAAPIDFERLSESDFNSESEPVLTALRQSEGATNADAIERAFNAETHGVDFQAANALRHHLWILAPKASWPNSLFPIGLNFSNFSMSWNQMQSAYGSKYLHVRLLPPVPRKTGILPDFGPEWNAKLLTNRPATHRRIGLLIDFSTPVDGLVEEFRAWVIANRPDIPRESQRPRGRKVHWERLKWLAAYRLAEAGYNFECAKEVIIQHQKVQKHDVRPDVLPLYASPGAWSDAVTKARTELSGDFTRSILRSFGYNDAYLH